MLFHFSDDPNIRHFVPRAPLAHPNAAPAVWAIAPEYEPLYMLPRDCPRIAFWPVAATVPAHRQRFWSGTGARFVIAVEWGWLQQIAQAVLWRYELPEEGFMPEGTPGHAGFYGGYTCRHAVTPRSVAKIDNLLQRMRQENVELRLVPELHSLAAAVSETTLHYSLIRMRNAAPKPDTAAD